VSLPRERERAPLPSAEREPAQKPQGSTLPKQALFWGGTGLAVSSAVVWGLAAVKLDNARERLDAACPAHVGDRCAQTSAAEQQNAQDAVDGIATYKAFRVGAYVGLGTGAALALFGLLLPDREAPVASARLSMTVAGDPQAPRLIVRGRF
jgi:hypothetical protein